MTKGLLVTVDGPIAEVNFDDYRGMQMLIGCSAFASASWMFSDEPSCYVDDDGLYDGAKPNRAVYEDGELLCIIFGNMLFCGFDPETGETVDISESEAAKVRERFGQGAEGPGSGREALCRLLLDDMLAESKKELVAHGKL